MSEHDTTPSSPSGEDIYWSFGKSDNAVLLIDGRGQVTHASGSASTLQEYLGALFALIECHEAALQAAAPAAHRDDVRARHERLDIDFILGDLPKLLVESREGIERVTRIVQDLKDFSYAGRDETMRPSDLHKAWSRPSTSSATTSSTRSGWRSTAASCCWSNATPRRSTRC